MSIETQTTSVPSDCITEEAGGEKNNNVTPSNNTMPCTSISMSDEHQFTLNVVQTEKSEAEGKPDIYKSENSVKLLETHIDSDDGSIVNDGLKQSNNSDETSKQNEINETEDDLKGQFFVYDGQNDDDSKNSDSGFDSPGIDKSLTLVMCRPSSVGPLTSGDLNTNSTTNGLYNVDHIDTDHMDGDSILNGSRNGNNETPSKINEEEIDSKTILVKSNEKKNGDDSNGESTKRDGHKNKNVPNNDRDGKVKSGETQVSDRFPSQSRTNIKHGKSRYRPQETVPEMDETREDVWRPVERVCQDEKVDDLGKSINPKMPWKHQNKGAGRNKYSITQDLLVDSSPLINSTLNRPRSSLSRPTSARKDLSRLGVSSTNNGEIIKQNTNCGKVNSFASNIPGAINQEDQRQSRLSFECTSSVEGDRKFTSIYQKRYTRLELRKALPRKSFFSCHEKSMKDAGLEIEDPASKRKAERLKAKLERIAKEFDPLPSKVVIETGKENNNKPSQGDHADVSILVTDVQSLVSDSNVKDEDGISTKDQIESHDVQSEDMVDAKLSNHMGLSAINHAATKKKRLHPEKSDHIECKPLSHYLEYVKENPSEYENHSHTPSATSKNKPIRRLINMGKAFELRHLGGSPKIREDDIIVMAAKALRPRSSDASRYYKPDQDKTSGLRGQDTSLRQTRPPSDDKRRQEKNASGATAAKDDDHHTTELERKKQRAEEWAMSVSTNTLTKAKIQSLRELGSDDDELTKWWIALRKCHYLRVRGFAD